MSKMEYFMIDKFQKLSMSGKNDFLCSIYALILRKVWDMIYIHHFIILYVIWYVSHLRNVVYFFYLQRKNNKSDWLMNKDQEKIDYMLDQHIRWQNYFQRKGQEW